MRKTLNDKEINEYNKNGEWTAKWITHPEASSEESAVFCYSITINITEDIVTEINVSADQRYLLYADGIKQGEGPERGDADNWFFETYQLALGKGIHTISALSWFIKYEDRPPVAQIFWRPAFLLQSKELPELLNTGTAEWKVQKVPGFSIDSPNHETYTGSRFAIHGSKVPWGFLSGTGGEWTKPAVLWTASNKILDRNREFLTKWHLRPSILKAQYEQPVRGLKAISVDYPLNDATEDKRISASSHEDIAMWQQFFDGHSPVTVCPNSRVRVIADLDNYYCVYHRLLTSGGKDALIRLRYAESLFENLQTYEKGNRNEFLGKQYHGVGFTYYPGGGNEEEYSSLWWIPGRYVEFYIETAGDELTLLSFEQTETHYDYDFDMNFSCSDKNVFSFSPIAYRALEMCTHETLMDCPFYEQLMYVGDTRLELLTAYSVTRDRKIAQKAIDTFDKSIGTEGLTKSRYPSHFEQHIPTFSLFYVSMVFDYMMHTDDLPFLKELIHGIRGIMDFFHRHINEKGLLQAPSGWNFTDWVPGFPGGHNEYTAKGTSGYYSIHYLYTLLHAAGLEKMLGEDMLAERYLYEARKLKSDIDKYFWKENENMYSEDTDGTMFWEHTQCLAVLTEMLSGDQVRGIMNSLKEKDYIHRTTIYFSHYLLEASAYAGRADIFFDRLDFWSHLTEQGFRTTPEAPNPTRSDCHAWGAHPLFHLQSDILGIRSASRGFGTVVIKPMLGNLEYAAGSYPHPDGDIICNFTRNDNILSGSITLPGNMTGRLIANGREYVISGGVNSF